MEIVITLAGGRVLDVDADTSFSFSWTNPFFFTGEIELRHSLDLSIPATSRNCKALNWSEKEIEHGMRMSRRCSIEIDGVQIVGKVFLKNYVNKRFNVLFVWGEELNGVLNENIGGYWAPGESMVVKPEKPLPALVSDFGFARYREVEYDGTFNAGVCLMPVINFGWMMESVLSAAGYTASINGVPLSSAMTIDDETNPYNYMLTPPSINDVQRFEIWFTNWRATGLDSANYQIYDDNGNPVTDAQAGIETGYVSYRTTEAGLNLPLFSFKAKKPMYVKFNRNTDIVCLVFSHTIGLMTVGGGNDFDYIAYDTEISLLAGDYFTLVNVADFDLEYRALKPFPLSEYIYYYYGSITNDETTAQPLSTLELVNNLPEISLIDIIANYCLMTSSYYVISGNEIAIFGTAKGIKEIQAGDADVVNLDEKRVVEVGELYRYIDGFARRNVITCTPADYVSEENKFGLSLNVGNDLLEDEDVFGKIDFNEGNMDVNGDAVFENFTRDYETGAVTPKPSMCIMFANPDGMGYAKHLSWVHGNYGIYTPLKRIVSNANTEVVKYRDSAESVMELSPNTHVIWRGCNWLFKELTWKDGIVEAKIVSIDNEIVNTFTPAPPPPPPGPLPEGYAELEYIESTGTQYLMTNHYPSVKTHIITDIQYTREDALKGGFNFVRWKSESGDVRTFGICDATNSNHYTYIFWGEYYHGGYHTFGQNTSAWFLKKHHIEIHENVLTVDDETYTIPNQDAYFPSTLAMPILGGVNIGQATTGSYCKCWYVKIYDDTELVYDFIPALRLADSKPGLYDTVNDVFYTNDGTGEFLYQLKE